jgi:uncharacterized protein (TIGR02996 family)
MDDDGDSPTPRFFDPVAPVEADFLVALRRSPADGDTRLVYADWLEEHGQKLKAEFLRLQCRLAAIPEEGPDGHAELVSIVRRLRSLSPASEAWWRAITARPAIEKCVRSTAQCPKRWDALVPTDEITVRRCGSCDRLVHFCATLVDVMKRAATKECVAFDASLVRTEALEAYDMSATDNDRLVGEIEAPEE